MADLKALAESLVSLTIKEANELVNILKDEYDIIFFMERPSIRKYTVVLSEIKNRRFTRLQLRKIFGISSEEAEEILNNLPYEFHTTNKEGAGEIYGLLQMSGAVVEEKI